MPLGPIHFGGFLLFAAAILLLVASISSPTVDNIAFLNIYNGRQRQTYGAFGYCTNVRGNDHGCSSSTVGYDITYVSGGQLDHRWTNDTVNHLTKVLVLHPVAAGIAFFAFLVTLCADRLGFICAAFIAFLAFVVSLVAMIFDFVVFGIVRHEINDNTSGSASYGSATWMTLAATIILFFAIFIVFFSCCAGMRNKKREYSNGYNNGGYVGNAGPEMGYATNRPWYSRVLNRNKY